MSLLATVCNAERADLSLSTNLLDIGFDSLCATELASDLVTTLGVMLDSDALVRLYSAATPADIIALVRGALEKAASRDAGAAAN
jgi:acyl carrier protein